MSCRAPWPVASSWRHAEPVRAWQGCARRWLLPGSIPRCAGRAWLRFSLLLLLLLPGRGIISASHVNSALNPAAWGCSHCLVVHMWGGKMIPQLWLRHDGEPKLLVLDEFQSLVAPLCSPSPSLPLPFRGAAHLGVTNYRVGAALISSVVWCFLTISCVAVSGKIQVNNTRLNFCCWVVWLRMRLWFFSTISWQSVLICKH